MADPRRQLAEMMVPGASLYEGPTYAKPQAPKLPRRGGVLDTIADAEGWQEDAPKPPETFAKAAGRAVNAGLGLVDHYAMGIPSAVGGLMGPLVNPAYKAAGLPEIGLHTAAPAREKGLGDLVDALPAGVGRDLIGLPEAFAGSVPGGVGHAAARTTERVGPPNRFDRQAFREALGDKRRAYEKMFGPVLGSESLWNLAEGASKVGIAASTGGMFGPWIGSAAGLGSAGLVTMDHAQQLRNFYKERKRLRSDALPPTEAAQPASSTNLSAYADLGRAALGQTGRAVERLVDPIYDALPSNSLGSSGGKLSGPQTSMGDARPGIRAYHGSPHDFDRFDMSKIGTGEGAQAYGHGLYFAEAEDVAKTYKTAGYDSLLKKIDDDAGHMYEVRINADPGDFLDWDKPLGQQPERARQILQQHGVKPDAEHVGNALNNAHDWSASINGWGRDSARKILASDLRDAGIPGIRYLDQGSRTAGEGSRNYVVFRDDIIDIVRKYGIAAAAAKYGWDAVLGVTEAQAEPADPRQDLARQIVQHGAQ